VVTAIAADHGLPPPVAGAPGMRLGGAELIDSREILPGQWMQSFHAPWLAVGSRAGQFVHVRTGDLSGLVLRRPFSLNTTDAASGTVTIHFRTIGRGTEWFTRLRPGDRIDLLGPLGRPFEVDPRSRHLLLVAGGLGIAGVRMLADEAIRDGRQVTLLFGAASAREVYPSSLLPDEVEYVVATDDGSIGHRGFVTELVPDYEAWADQSFACGPWPMLAALSRLASTRRGRLGVATLGRKRGGGRPPAVGSPVARRKAFLQVSMEQNMGCAVGACLGCVVMSTGGQPQRVCREGPVFASDEIAWDSGWGSVG
jgi:dihydroorotate dehydrogenase electron transfer subunit